VVSRATRCPHPMEPDISTLHKPGILTLQRHPAGLSGSLGKDMLSRRVVSHLESLSMISPQIAGWKGSFAILLLVHLACTPTIFAGPREDGTTPGLEPIRSYISSGWSKWTRSMNDCGTVDDPELSGASVLYLPADFSAPEAVERIQKECRVQVKRLPAPIHGPGGLDPGKIDPPGLLYLENRYVVPGGRFNEMYGGESYFIILGLVRDGRAEPARGIAENFFFEIEHYGALLNANRTYYLTRSQPPVLTCMIRSVYEAQKAAGHEERAWLAKAYKYARKITDWGTEASILTLRPRF